MKSFSIARSPFWVALVLLTITSSATVARAEEPLKGEAVLVWGTNEPKSPDPKHKPVDPELAKKFNNSPFRWKYYYEVNRQALDIPVGNMKKDVKMSSHCVLDIKNLGKSRIEVTLYGEGKLVSWHREPFLDNWPLILAGSAGNDTSWFVIIRKIQPAPVKIEKASTN